MMRLITVQGFSSCLHGDHSAYRIFLRIADFDPEDVVQQPVDGLLLVEHEDELNNEVQVWSLEHFSCKKDRERITGGL